MLPGNGGSAYGGKYHSGFGGGGGGGGGYSGGGGPFLAASATNATNVLTNVSYNTSGNGLVSITDLGPLISAISTTVFNGVVLGTGRYGDQLTITNLGVVLPSLTGAAGLGIGKNDYVLNQGSIFAGTGGIGVYLNGGTFVNNGYVAGGTDGYAVQFGGDPSELVLEPGSTLSGSITGFAIGDTIVADGFDAVSGTFISGIGLLR